MHTLAVKSANLWRMGKTHASTLFSLSFVIFLFYKFYYIFFKQEILNLVV